MPTYRPIGNNVILAPIKPDLKLGSGLVRPEAYVDARAFKQYRVMATGPGKRLKNGAYRPIEVEVGSNVMATEIHDHGTFPDGCKVMDASELIATWGSE